MKDPKKTVDALKNLIEAEHSKRQMIKIVRYVGDSQEKFDALITFCFGTDERLAQCAAYPVGVCIENNPSFGNKHLKKMLSELKKKRHNAIKRSFTRSMSFMEIPKSLEAKTISVCFDLLNDKNEFLAIKVFSMTVLGNLCMKYPELKEELKSSIESQMPFQTPGFRSRGRKVLQMVD